MAVYVIIMSHQRKNYVLYWLRNGTRQTRIILINCSVKFTDSLEFSGSTERVTHRCSNE